MLYLVPKRKAKFPFLHLIFSIKVCYGEISWGIRAAAAARRRRRSKFPHPDRGHKSARSRGSACASEERALDEETARACVRAYVRATALFFFGLSPKSQVLRGFACHTTTWLVQIGPQIKAKVQLRCAILGAGSSLVVSNHLFFFFFWHKMPKLKGNILLHILWFFFCFGRIVFAKILKKVLPHFYLGFKRGTISLGTKFFNPIYVQTRVIILMYIYIYIYSAHYTCIGIYILYILMYQCI